jgi:hypothetical protein
VSGTFEASYPGTCDTCWEPIEEGDEVAYDSGGNLVHTACNDDDDSDLFG